MKYNQKNFRNRIANFVGMPYRRSIWDRTRSLGARASGQLYRRNIFSRWTGATAFSLSGACTTAPPSRYSLRVMRRVVNRSSGIGSNQHLHAEHACQLSGSANLACEVRLEGVSGPAAYAYDMVIKTLPSCYPSCAWQ